MPCLLYQVVQAARKKAEEEEAELKEEELREAELGDMPDSPPTFSLGGHKSMPYFSPGHGAGDSNLNSCSHSALKSGHSPMKPRKSVSFVFAEGGQLK